MTNIVDLNSILYNAINLINIVHNKDLYIYVRKKYNQVSSLS